MGSLVLFFTVVNGSRFVRRRWNSFPADDVLVYQKKGRGWNAA
ncbi:MAG: hypothetical protein ACLVD1_06290 [Lacrimispora saccharolytica]